MKIHFCIRLLFLFALYFISSSSNAQYENWSWARGGSGTGESHAHSLTCMSNGDVFVAGGFKATSLTVASTTLINCDTTTNLNQDAFLAKYSQNGNLLWARSFGGREADEITAIAADNTGNIFVTGYYRSDSVVLPGYVLRKAANCAVCCNTFLIKMDSNGNIIWCKDIIGTADVAALSLATDGSNVFLTGYFCGSYAVFDSDTVKKFTQFWSDQNIFVAKFSGSGAISWTKSAGCSFQSQGNDITCDNSGNVIVTGFVNCFPPLVLGNDTVTNSNPQSGATEAFLLKYNNSGNLLWARAYGGTSFDDAYEVITDGNNNIYSTGVFMSKTLAIDSVSVNNTMQNEMTGDAYLTKFDSTGKALWIRKIGGNSVDQGKTLTLGPNGTIFWAGEFVSPQLTIGATTYTNANPFYVTPDIFLAKYDASGTLLGSSVLSSLHSDEVSQIKSDGWGHKYICGESNGSALVFNQDSVCLQENNFDFYLAKLDNNLLGIADHNKSKGYKIWPTPVQSKITIEDERAINLDPFTVRVCSVLGEELFKSSSEGQKISMDLYGLKPGMYIIKIDGQSAVAEKIIYSPTD